MYVRCVWKWKSTQVEAHTDRQAFSQLASQKNKTTTVWCGGKREQSKEYIETGRERRERESVYRGSVIMLIVRMELVDV